MLGFKVLKLKTENEKNIFYNNLMIIKLKKEIEELLKEVNGFDSFSELLSSTNQTKEDNNLAKGYFYILQNNKIDKDSLKELYDILSEDLLDDYSKENMDKYYRKGNVFITDSSFNEFVGYFDKGVSPNKIEEMMNNLIEYINEDNEKSEVEKYIKSQVIHYYLVYVHPYYDVNGRTARTLSSWYLLNNRADECILYNKGISSNKDEYKKAIKKTRGRTTDITPFIEYSLKTLKQELEKVINKEDKKVRR